MKMPFNIDLNADTELAQYFGEVGPVIEKCYDFINAQLPASVHSQTVAHIEKASHLSSELIDMMNTTELATNFLRNQINKRRKDLMEEAFEEYGRNKWAGEAVVDGDPQLSDLILKSECLNTTLKTLEKLLWLVKSVKDQVATLYERSRLT